MRHIPYTCGVSVLTFACDGCTLATPAGTCQVAGNVDVSSMITGAWQGSKHVKRELVWICVKSGNPSSNDGICGLGCSLTCNESSTYTSQHRNSPPKDGESYILPLALWNCMWKSNEKHGTTLTYYRTMPARTAKC